MRDGKEEDADHGGSSADRTDPLRIVRVDSSQRHRASGALRRSGQGGYRTCQSAFTASHLAFLEQLTASIGIVLNSIEATMQTEGLLKQSQQLAIELQMQQKELQQTNENSRRRHSNLPTES